MNGRAGGCVGEGEGGGTVRRFNSQAKNHFYFHPPSLYLYLTCLRESPHVLPLPAVCVACHALTFPPPVSACSVPLTARQIDLVHQT